MRPIAASRHNIQQSDAGRFALLPPSGIPSVWLLAGIRGSREILDRHSGLLMRDALKLMFALLFGLALVTGCGQSGPLFLPGDPGAAQSSVPVQVTPEPTESSSGDDDDEDEAEADNN